jgi:hypothetical protein
MKLPTIVKIRILILLLIAVCEICGLTLFYGKQSFVEFSFLSLLGVSLITRLLSTDWTKERGGGLTGGILFASGFCLMGLKCWNKGDHVSGVALVVPILIAVIGTYGRLGRPGKRSNPELREALSRKAGLREIPASISLALVVLFVDPAVVGLAAIRSWLYYSSPRWGLFLGSIAFVELCTIVFAGFLFIKWKTTPADANASPDPLSEHGGRA